MQNYIKLIDVSKMICADCVWVFCAQNYVL